MKKWKKPLSILSTTALLSGVLFTANADASLAVKKVDAHYKNIKIINNNQDVKIDPLTEPFIVNGVTYIPLRLMGELYNKNVVWSGATSTITIQDKTVAVSQGTVDVLNAQIKVKDAQIKAKDDQIAQLQAEITKLKDNQKTQKSVSLKDLEKELNKDYGDYKDIRDVDITLSGTEKKPTLRIEVNSSDWNKLSSSKKTSFLQDIIDDILDEYSNADISGSIRDERNGKEIVSFDVDSKDKVKLDAGTSLRDLEDDLNDEYYDYDDIDDIDISLDGNKDRMKLTIEVEGSDWEVLKERDKTKFLQSIVDDILYKYEDALIEGIVEDDDNGKKLASFYADGMKKGDVILD